MVLAAVVAIGVFSFFSSGMASSMLNRGPKTVPEIAERIKGDADNFKSELVKDQKAADAMKELGLKVDDRKVDGDTGPKDPADTDPLAAKSTPSPSPTLEGPPTAQPAHREVSVPDADDHPLCDALISGPEAVLSSDDEVMKFLFATNTQICKGSGSSGSSRWNGNAMSWITH